MRWLAVILLLAGCDWDKFSRNYAVDVDSGSSSGSALCNTSNGRFCDDFEAASLNSAWSPPATGGGGTWTLDDTKSKSGAQSLKIHIDATTNADIEMVFNETQSLAAEPRGFYARVFVWPQNVVGDYGFMEAISDGGNFSGMHIGVDGTENVEVSDWANTPSFYEASQTSLTSASWRCVEWRVIEGTQGNTDGGMQVWVDDDLVSDLDFESGLVTVPGDFPLATFGLGLFVGAAGTSASFDAWFDDLVIANVRVGCNP